MPRIPLTDIRLKNLKPSVRQVQYWDLSLPSFGCRVSQKGTKTFNIMTGKDRRLIKIGNYPSMSLSETNRRKGRPKRRQDSYPHRQFRVVVGHEYNCRNELLELISW